MAPLEKYVQTSYEYICIESRSRIIAVLISVWRYNFSIITWLLRPPPTFLRPLRFKPGRHAMNFYFCDKCGTRVTEQDMATGRAVDKQVQGIFCAKCATDVSTKEFSPVSTEDPAPTATPTQVSPKENSIEPSKSTTRPSAKRMSGAHPRASRTKISSAKRRQRHSSASSIPKGINRGTLDPAQAAEIGDVTPSHRSARLPRANRAPNSKVTLISGLTILLFLATIAAFAFRRNPPTTRVSQRPEKLTKPTPVKITVPRQRMPDRPPPKSTLQTPHPKAAIETPPRPVDPLEFRAREAWDRVLLFESPTPLDASERIQRIEAFLAEYGQTLIAAQARVRLEKLKVKSPESEPVPPKPTTQTESSPEALNVLPKAQTPAPESPALRENFEAARAAWRSGRLTELETLLQSRAEQAKDDPLARLIQSALDFQACAATYLKGMDGKQRVKLAFKNQSERFGWITSVHANVFAWRTSTQPIQCSLFDLSFRTRIDWVENQLKDSSRQSVLTTAAALLELPHEEAQAFLAKAPEKAQHWKPFLVYVKNLQGKERNEAAWKKLEPLAARQKEKLIEQAEAFLKNPPGGTLSSTLHKKVMTSLGAARAQQMTELTGLYLPARGLPDGRLELSYDFTDPKQILDFEKKNPPAQISEGALHVQAGSVIRHLLPLEGDLSISYEIAIAGPSPNRISLRFYDLSGEFGGSDNAWTAMWRSDTNWNSPLAKKPDVRISRGKWHHIKLDYTNETKRTILNIDGREILTFNDPKAAGKGYVFLGARLAAKIRKFRIQGRPYIEKIQQINQKRAFAENLMDALSQGGMVKLFTKNDQAHWNTAKNSKWTLTGNTVTGAGRISMPGFRTQNYELKLEMRRASGQEANLNLRMMKNSRYRLVFQDGQILAQYFFNDPSKRKILKTIKADTSKFHSLHIFSKEKLLRVVLDNKEILLDLKDVPANSPGFSLDSYKGQISFRGVEGRFLK